MSEAKAYRHWIRNEAWKARQRLQTDQEQGLPSPAVEQPYPPGTPLIDLVPPEALTVGDRSVREVIQARRSRRKFTSDALTIEELSFLLWATQGVREVHRGGRAVFRTVPSAGARHPFETYLAVNRVDGLEPGLYRYLSVEHKLYLAAPVPELAQQTASACFGQSFVRSAAVVFIWTAVPYRTEWRYSVVSPKLIALDAGHVCQALYIACEAIGAGTCAIAAYDQTLMDALLGVDGDEEFTIYVAPVGKV